ncbi:MAG: hypothetical protein RX318_07980 [bacterium]|nr:hypothetical protein [bacterium]
MTTATGVSIVTNHPEHGAQLEVDTFSSELVFGDELVYTENKNGTNSVVSMGVVEFKGDEVLINPERMRIGVPYPFPFGGGHALIVKRADGGIDFYAVGS